MSIRFLDPEQKVDVRSTEFARRVLAEAAKGYPELQQDILGAPDWRKWYLRLYARLAIEEGKSREATAQIASRGLAEFQAHLTNGSGSPILDEVKKGWGATGLVETFTIVGNGPKAPIKISGQSSSLESVAQQWVDEALAEPGLIEAFRFLDENPELNLGAVPLFAVAGAAEFAPTEDWLRWGGTVAVVARSNPETWRRLISMARATNGTLLVPVMRSRLVDSADLKEDQALAMVAGMDIAEDCCEIASWLSEMASKSERIALGLYAYTPSTNHIRVQGVQDALAEVALEHLPPEKLSLSWLATPTDSAPGPESIGRGVLKRYASRKPLRILRDSLLGLFGAARAPQPKFFQGESGGMCLIDSSVQQQGPSYSFSKRTQRWRAYLAHYRGFRVSYAVAPPARTDSVLSHRILRASYQGAPHFGVKPFEVATAKSAMAAVLARDLFDPNARPDENTTIGLQTGSAIHGGLWRIPYRPRSVWIAATVIGLGALLKKGY